MLKRKISKTPAILLGGDAVNALAVLRNLGENGVPTFCIGEERNEAAFSKHCRSFVSVPGIEKSNKILASYLIEHEEQFGHQTVLFPCSDLFCVNLSQIQDEIKGHYVFAANKDISEHIVDKKKFYRSLKQNGIPHPATYFPEDWRDLREIGRRLGYPLYLRPAITQLFTKYFPKKGLVAWSQGELEKYGKMISRHDIEFVVQEIIPGTPTHFFGLNGYLDKNHNPKGLFAYHRIREWPLGFGNGSLIESIPISSVPILKDITLRYLKNVRYSGLFDAEFKKDPRDGNFKLLEINVRSWWQNHFPTVCGVNLVMMAYLDAIGEETEYVETYRTGLKWVFFFNDFLSFSQLFKKGQITILHWLRSYKKVKDFAYFNPNDPVPSIVWPLINGPIYFRALLRRLSKKNVKNDRIPNGLFQ